MMYGGDNRDGSLFTRLHLYYARLAFVRFEHFVHCGSLMNTNMYLYTYLRKSKVLRVTYNFKD